MAKRKEFRPATLLLSQETVDTMTRAASASGARLSRHDDGCLAMQAPDYSAGFGFFAGCERRLGLSVVAALIGGREHDGAWPGPVTWWWPGLRPAEGVTLP